MYVGRPSGKDQPSPVARPDKVWEAVVQQVLGGACRELGGVRSYLGGDFFT